MTSAHRTSEEGFTLLELLVSLSLLALLTAVLLSGFNLGFRAWDRSEGQSEALNELQSTQAALRRLLSEARPVLQRLGDHNIQPSLEGSATDLRFVTVLPTYLGSAGTYRVTLDTRSNDLQQDLILITEAFGSADKAESDETAPAVLLLEDISGLVLAYYGVKEGEREATWHSSWAEAGRLPLLVRLDVKMKPSDRRSWPPLTVATRIDGAVR